MYDINFYMQVAELKNKEMPLPNDINVARDILRNLLEDFRSVHPVVYDIETTNVCNMHCVACPRTKMTRPIGTMDMKLFEKIIEQVRPWQPLEWVEWENFVLKFYQVNPLEMSENSFFLYVIPKVLTLHGYGDPLLDKDIPLRIEKCAALKIPTYLSCNPCNIDRLFDAEELLKAGLDYLKFSTDSVDDFSVKQIRGKEADFSKSFEKVNKLIKLVKDNGYKTKIVITMIDLGKPNQKQEFERLKTQFTEKNVYIYLKSQDQRWLRENESEQKAIHWREFCQHPWTSMSIQWDGTIVPCHVDYNNEIIMGDAKKNLLMEIWNGDTYKDFRELHLIPYGTLKCQQECDMQLLGSVLNVG